MSNCERLSRDALTEHQLQRLHTLLRSVLATNAFYRPKAQRGRNHASRGHRRFGRLSPSPLLPPAPSFLPTKSPHPPSGTNLTYPPERYTRIHQTSGTTGQRLRWLDTAESWDWWGRCWAQVYRAAGVSERDRIFFAFSFGPFIGFWSGHQGASHIGALIVPGGGMSSAQRLDAIIENEITVLVCTPTYALHLGEVARERGLDLGCKQCTHHHPRWRARRESPRYPRPTRTHLGCSLLRPRRGH